MQIGRTCKLAKTLGHGGEVKIRGNAAFAQSHAVLQFGDTGFLVATEDQKTHRKRIDGDIGQRVEAAGQQKDVGRDGLWGPQDGSDPGKPPSATDQFLRPATGTRRHAGTGEHPHAPRRDGTAG